MSTENVHHGADAERKRIFKITIDKVHHFELQEPQPTGRELLTLAGKIPVEQYGIYLKHKGAQPQRIQLDERVDLREAGVEHFVTLPLDQTEG
jgi:hypothetical protein